MQMAPGAQIAKQEKIPADASPDVPAPESAQGGDAEKLAFEAKGLMDKLKQMVEPEVFANFIQSHILGSEAAQPTEAPRPVVSSFEGGMKGQPTV